jgi:hypothetical protein
MALPKFWLSLSLPTSWPTLAERMNYRVGSGALASQKLGNYPNKSRTFGHDQTKWYGTLWSQPKHTPTSYSALNGLAVKLCRYIVLVLCTVVDFSFILDDSSR